MVNGFKLQLVLKQLNADRDLYVSAFADSLFAFEGEKKRSPKDVFFEYRGLEEKIARVQTGQLLFNTTVNVTVMGETITLAEAVKRVGGATRMEKMWRALLKKEDTPRWARSKTDELSRSKDEVYAVSQITRDEVMAQIRITTDYTAAVREAIQKGNSNELKLEALLLTEDCLRG